MIVYKYNNRIGPKIFYTCIIDDTKTNLNKKARVGAHRGEYLISEYKTNNNHKYKVLRPPTAIELFQIRRVLNK